MQDWQEVRSFGDLAAFQDDFRSLDEAEQRKIICEMLMVIAIFKEKESQLDLFQTEGKSVDKSTKLFIKRKRRKTRRLPNIVRPL